MSSSKYLVLLDVKTIVSKEEVGTWKWAGGWYKPHFDKLQDRQFVRIISPGVYSSHSVFVAVLVQSIPTHYTMIHLRWFLVAWYLHYGI